MHFLILSSGFFFLFLHLAPPQVSLQPVGPIILNNITDTFTFIGTCTAYGIPNPTISWTSLTTERESRLLDASSSFINITSTETGNMTVSIITVKDLNITERGSSVECSAVNVVTNASATLAPYLAGENYDY